jgi:Tfp pilus assembly protein PilX
MTRARNEEGFAVVAAVVLLTVIMGLGLGLLLFTDSQQKASTRQQASEAAFNVAEAALNAQVGQLSREWPTQKSAETNPLPASCTASTSTEKTNDCPSSADLKLDPNTGSTTCPAGTDTSVFKTPLSNQWTTYVRQDLSEGSGESERESSLFNSTTEYEKPTYAKSEAGALWVRSVGVVQCHPVAVVTLVTRQRVTLNFPQYAIAGNWFKVTNKGKKVIVNRKGNANEAGEVSMRCESPPPEGCEQYEGGSKEQVSPPITGNPTSSNTTLTPSQLATVKSEAQAHGTFYSSTAPYHCPTSMNELEGVALTKPSRAPVYVEGCGSLTIKANGTANCEPPTPAASPPKPESPGFLVIANGTLELGGNSTYCGVIYAANLNPKPLSEEAIVKLQGGTVVVGGIIVDGAGGIEFGSSGQGGNPANLVFDSLAIDNLTISAGAAATRNSFRILPAGQ